MSKFKPNPDPLAQPEAIVISDKVRFTVLTSRLIRMEFDLEGNFEDRPSLTYWYRNQPVPAFTVKREDNWLRLETDELILHFYENNRFHWRDLWIEIKKTAQQWHYGDRNGLNLGGTCRTLDSTEGAVPLEEGLVSLSGWSLVDDSQTPILDENLWPICRDNPAITKDLYFYGYAQDYLGAIQDHQLISGKPNLLPRWALGNWWSRYWAYSDSDLLNLMDEFKAKEVPLSVCIVDMDWHKTVTNNASSGWTGYSWNRDLFPNPEAFIDEIHQRNLKTALNLHPAEGVHNHEDQYAEMATHMELDPNSGQFIPFEIADPKFAKAYFDVLHAPLEKQGIDFWWLDWQQGSKSKIEGLDPLFWLNHLHNYDQAKTEEKRPFIFSRWPGLGGQRYPIGFSGDTVVAWSTLNFQPEMTATASNVAYGWWSHDIGGHAEGIEDGELYLRWVQFGVFSPIFRLHSTNNEYINRLPWAFGLDIFQLARFAMQLRHKLIPYIYTANERNARTGEPLILPMYYNYPEENSAYACPNEYTFGQNMLLAPITKPAEKDTNLTRHLVWFPDGYWTNFFTNESYQGNFWQTLYYDRADIPAFVPDGSIIPLNANPVGNGVELPKKFLVKVFLGEKGEFDLYEDAGEGQGYLEGQFAQTLLHQSFQDKTLKIVKEASRGDYLNFLPENRLWQFEINNISQPSNLSIFIDGEALDIEKSYDENLKILTFSAIPCPNASKIEIHLEGVQMVRFETTPIDRIENLLKAFRLPTITKQTFKNRLDELFTNPYKLFDIAHSFSKSQLLAIFESVSPANLNKPADDLYNAFEAMMAALRKLGG